MRRFPYDLDGVCFVDDWDLRAEYESDVYLEGPVTISSKVYLDVVVTVQELQAIAL